MTTRHRIVRKSDGKYYPQTKGFFCWSNFYSWIQYEIIEVVCFDTYQAASDFLQQKFDERERKVKHTKAIYPWSPKP